MPLHQSSSLNIGPARFTMIPMPTQILSAPLRIVAALLRCGKSLIPTLWSTRTCLGMESGQHLPSDIRGRVVNAYEDLGDRNTLEAGDNPVLKIPLGVAGVDLELIIDLDRRDTQSSNPP